MRRIMLTGASAMTLAALAPAGALGDSTIGSTLTGTGLQNICSASIACTYFQTSGGSPAATSPIDGTVTSWKVKADSAGSPVKLRVLRRSGANYTGVATSATQTTTGGSAIDTFSTSLPIKTGDAIGLDNDSSALLFATTSTIPLAAVYYFQLPALADGVTSAPSNQSPAGYELQLQATITPSPPGGGGGGGGASPTTPSTSALKLAPNAFKAATSGASIAAKGKKAKTGSTVSYKLSADATVKFTAQRAQKGRKSGGKCVKARKGQRGKRCTRYKAVSGSFSVAGISGSNSFKFTGRISSRKLGKGKYRLSATPSAGGKTGKAATASFKIK